MTQPFQAKRPICARCLRPLKDCICRWIAPTQHAVEVVILQHPLEASNAKGSARLLHLSLPCSRLVIGETFSEQELQELLHGPFDSGNAVDTQARQAILLYPDTPQHKALGMAAPPVLEQMALRDPTRLRLVVLDGTWRKSRKLLYLNPLLQKLPRLPLQDTPASQYRIRKNHRLDQLSTLEAVCYALMRLEGGTEKYLPLLAAFQGFVEQQFGYCAVSRSDDRRS
ncbi:MAG TPA: tRNA-uridine aminocarboxypropyltransferase [Noviherbaspirillum sp.]|nr:tRNA-uridine aminocarboxypropyltransferase [Noviherbaspirillum sp.]